MGVDGVSRGLIRIGFGIWVYLFLLDVFIWLVFMRFIVIYLVVGVCRVMLLY